MNVLEGSLDVVMGNLFGTDKTGNAAIGNGSDGVQIILGKSDRIGGLNPVTQHGAVTLTAGNVISGNGRDGIFLERRGPSTSWRGTSSAWINASGKAAPIGNGGQSAWPISNGTKDQIGGTATRRPRNVISGNRDDGIYISAGTVDVVEGNYIGTDVTGDEAIGNGGNGVEITG